ncbi:acetylxylan esterase [Sporothrix schenckii 1099-18]|uniref:Carboxylic ester hydrolase n=1 Tax=Sporothrix schenckii 1099-18 TaxID=1397361 RepID=A0A0F2M2H2_SPOSC|nr:acetylxylan esterase [Sporothrix schenckii 1099-18]KJR83913.1 acetylxylan esterase [Sporothrix schenckii 1099-18]
MKHLSLATAALVASTQAALVSVSNFGDNPTGLQMSIYVPNKLATKPAVILAMHTCGGTGQQYLQMSGYTTLADAKGFLVIYPTTTHDNNCWDVASKKSLTHEGGGDSQTLANMIRYTISKYGADPAKVFATGSSSGCMMTNVMMAVYPDIIAAATCYSGVAAGCLAGSPGSSPSTANPNCASGRIVKSGAEWAAEVRGMYPGWNGSYPRLATWHGHADTFVSYLNLQEQIKEWSTLLDVTYVKNLTATPQAGYTEMVFGDGTKFVAYSAEGVGHTVPVHPQEDLKWFGIV